MASEPDPILMQGQVALRAMDKVLHDKPNKAGQDFSDAIRQLSLFRDGLIGRYRAGGSNPIELPRLGQLNAALTVVISGHYPLGKIPWPHIEKARESIATLLAEMMNGVERQAMG